MKSYYLENYERFVAMVWVIVAIIFFLQFSSHIPFIDAIIAVTVNVLLIYPFTTYLSKHLLIKAVRKRRIAGFIPWFLLFSVMVALILTSIVHIYYYLEEKGSFVWTEIPISQDTIYQTFTSALLLAICINFGFCGLRFYQENLRLQKILIDSQLEILHAQINPHFMFNVLNHIHVLMQKDVEMSSELLLNYSGILRYQLYNGKKESVQLEEEVNFLKKYIDIEKIRWQGKLNVTAQWIIQNGKQQISPLMFITFIENAFKHVSRSSSQKGYIDISLRQEEKFVRLTVTNSTSPLKKESPEDSGIGLENIRQRLNILYPERYQLHIKEEENTYHSELTINL